jgi:hypothetical protein
VPVHRLCLLSEGLPPVAAGFQSRLVQSQSINWFRIMAGRELKVPKKTDYPGESIVSREQEEDLEIIEQLLDLALEAVARKTPDVRLADILKLLEFKHRLKPQADARQIFWEWIERFRREAANSESGIETAKDNLPDLDGPANGKE